LLAKSHVESEKSADLDAALERFSGRRTAQGDHLRHRFAVLPSYQQPRYLLPLGDSRTTLGGFRFYTPYDMGGRLRKVLLGLLVKTGWSGWAMHPLYVGEPLGLKALVTNVAGERSPVFAMGLGTPGKYRKLTIQVMRAGGETLGYIKLGLTAVASDRVRHEARILDNISGLQPDVPRVLYAGQWQDSFLLFQSPLEGRPGPVELSAMHVEFLENLGGLRRVDKAGLRVLDEVGGRWDEASWRCDWRWQRLGTAALATARRELDKVTVPCGFSHGDFVPWNTRVVDGRLMVYDWEACEGGVPLGWDAFHFSMQMARRRRENWRTKFDLAATPGARGVFILYLLASLGKALDERAEVNENLEYCQRVLTDELTMR